MVQRSAVELFASIGVAIAPTPAVVGTPRFGPDDLVGIVQVSLNGMKGNLALATSPATLARAKSPSASTSIQDWLRELANQLGGRLKNRLARYQVAVEVSLPTAFGRNALDRSIDFKGVTTVYAFRTIRDDVHVVLSGDLGNTDLRFSGGDGMAEEGDLIFF